MATRRHRGPSKKARKRVRRAAVPGLQAVGTERRAPPVRAERESIEDALEDWAEDEVQRDDWLIDRKGEDVQRDES